MSRLTMFAAMAAMVAFAALPALAQSEGGEKVTVCHKPGTPAEHTLEIDNSALEAHKAHGDAEGECEDGGASAEQYEDSGASAEQYEDGGASAEQYGDVSAEAGSSANGAASAQYSDDSAVVGTQNGTQTSAESQYADSGASTQNNTQINQNISAGGDVNQNFFLRFLGGVGATLPGAGE